MSELELAVVGVPVTVLWRSPDAPGPADEPVTRDEPDHAAWVAGLKELAPDYTEDRFELLGRIESELVQGEPVRVVGSDESGRWTQVLAAWQPHPDSADGYPGWVRTAHLVADEAAAHDVLARGPVVATDEDSAVELARQWVGLDYLWGGTTPDGFDCSGLVHHIYRQWGTIVPRDAYAQADWAEDVDLDDVEPGDLYFFAHPDRPITHVGIVVSPGRMVHASETGGVLVEEDLPEKRRQTLVAAGRLSRL